MKEKTPPKEDVGVVAGKEEVRFEVLVVSVDTLKLMRRRQGSAGWDVKLDWGDLSIFSS